MTIKGRAEVERRYVVVRKVKEGLITRKEQIGKVYEKRSDAENAAYNINADEAAQTILKAYREGWFKQNDTAANKGKEQNNGR